MDYSLPQFLQRYIEEELQQGVRYRIIADLAPGPCEREVFLELSEKGREQADRFNDIYMSITGYRHMPPEHSHITAEQYESLLRQLISAESRAFNEYHRQFMKAGNIKLRNVCYEISSDKLNSINRLMQLLKTTDEM